jgi:DNA sulfur modification protein DndE
MQPPVDTVRISQRGREMLIKLKRNTGIEHWNTLCRWGFCASLRSGSIPGKLLKSEDSNIEMTWKTFTGPLNNEILASFHIRAAEHGINISDKSELSEYFKRHLHRGLFILEKTKSLEALLGKPIIQA